VEAVEAARALRIEYAVIWRWIARGAVRAQRRGGRWLIHLADAKELAAARSTAAAVQG